MSENVLRSSTARQNGLAELAQRALTTSDLSTLLVETAGLLTDATGGDVTALESQPDGSLRVHATVGGDITDAGQPETDSIVPSETVEGTILGRALDATEPVVADSSPATGPFAAYETGGVYAPITDDEGRPWGLVTIHTAEATTFDEETMTFIENATSVLGSAFERLRREPAGPDGEPPRETDVHEVSGWGGTEQGAALDEVFGRVTDAFVALDSDWRFTYANEQAEELLDRTTAELIGESLWDVFPDTMDTTFEAKYRHAMETGEAVSFEEYYPPLDAWFAVRAYPSETGLSIYFRDVTDRRKREQELAGLHDVNQQFPHAETPDGIADVLVDAATDVLGLPGATVYLHEADSETLTAAAQAGTLSEPYQELPAVDATESDSLISRAFLTGETQRQQDIAPLASPIYSGAHLRQGLFVPLGEHGVLVAGDIESGAFADRTIELAEVLAANAASELDRIERELDLRERERELVSRSEQQAAVAELGQRALATTDLDALFQEASTIVADRLDTDYCKVLDLLPSGDELLLRAGVGWQDGLVGTATVGTGADSQAGHTLQSEEPVVVEGLDDDTRFSGPDLLVDHDVVSGISVIIGSKEDPWGVLGTHDTDRREFTEQDVDFVQSVATLLATAIERESYERELEQYETMVETVADGVFVVDSTGTLKRINDTFAEMTGYDRGELIGSKASRITSQETQTTANRLTEELVEGDRDVATIEATLYTKDGESVPIEARFAPIEMEDGEHGRVGVMRDITDRKQFEETLTTLHESSRELLEAESREEIAQVAVETAVDVLGLEATSVYLFEDEHALHPAAYTEFIADLFGDPPPTFSSGDESITWRAFLEGETVQHDDVLDDEYIEEPDVPLRSGLWIPLGDHGVFTTLSEEVGAFDEDMERLADLLAATTETALSRLAREETLRDREQDLEERNERLTKLDRINGIIRDIDQALVSASTREDIESAVCERLTDQAGLEFAWVGETDTTTDEVVARTWAGNHRGYLDAIDLDSDGDEPACRTERTRETTVVDNVAEGLRTESWRKKALAREFQSVVSVPIKTNELSYGTLTVYSGDHAQVATFADILRELGETIGNAIDSAEARRTMHTDAGVGVDLQVSDDDPFSLLARHAGCTVEFEGLITQETGEPRVCVTTSGAPAEEIMDAAQSLASIDTVSLLSKKDDGHEALFEVSTYEPSLATAVADLGATPKQIRTDGDGLTATVILSDAVSVRQFVERLRSRYPSTELVARRDQEHTQQTPRLFRTNVEEELTDRQQEVLQTAYLSGYFEWPRESTGEELADALGISQPTVNRHLRTAERKVYTLLFES